VHGFLLLRHNADVEDSREDEDQTGGRCGTWRRKRMEEEGGVVKNRATVYTSRFNLRN
jgi:hypothetical protein